MAKIPDYGICGKLATHDAVIDSANAILEHCAKICEEEGEYNCADRIRESKKEVKR